MKTDPYCLNVNHDSYFISYIGRYIFEIFENPMYQTLKTLIKCQNILVTYN